MHSPDSGALPLGGGIQVGQDKTRNTNHVFMSPVYGVFRVSMQTQQGEKTCACSSFAATIGTFLCFRRSRCSARCIPLFFLRETRLDWAAVALDGEDAVSMGLLLRHGLTVYLVASLFLLRSDYLPFG